MIDPHPQFDRLTLARINGRRLADVQFLSVIAAPHDVGKRHALCIASLRWHHEGAVRRISSLLGEGKQPHIPLRFG
ncbi:MAG: hypothetical protein R3C02_05425 [Planctomycetaceae bacterium]